MSVPLTLLKAAHRQGWHILKEGEEWNVYEAEITDRKGTRHVGILDQSPIARSKLSARDALRRAQAAQEATLGH